jgi:hypothetical protein
MYIDFKIAVWERIKVPKELEKEFRHKILKGEIASPEDALSFLGDRTEYNYERLSDTIEMVKTENNDGEATFQMFDNNHNLIFSNDNNYEEQSVSHLNKNEYE